MSICCISCWHLSFRSCIVMYSIDPHSTLYWSEESFLLGLCCRVAVSPPPPCISKHISRFFATFSLFECMTAGSSRHFYLG